MSTLRRITQGDLCVFSLIRIVRCTGHERPLDTYLRGGQMLGF